MNDRFLQTSHVPSLLCTGRSQEAFVRLNFYRFTRPSGSFLNRCTLHRKNPVTCNVRVFGADVSVHRQNDAPYKLMYMQLLGTSLAARSPPTQGSVSSSHHHHLCHSFTKHLLQVWDQHSNLTQKQIQTNPWGSCWFYLVAVL